MKAAIYRGKKWDIESIITHEYKHTDICKALDKASNANSALNLIIKFD